ncbi:MAG: CoA-binding protein [Alphaproteobacteria bacterium]
MPHRLAPLLTPRSIALVGASTKPGSQGNNMVRELKKGGFKGKVYAVNPNYDEVEGIPCFPSLADLPEPVELVSLGVATHRIEEQLTAAAAIGAKAAVVFASGYLAEDPERTLLGRVAAIARAADMRVCGGNCMGFNNLARGINVAAFETPDWLEPGNITLITHSGTLYGEIVNIDRRLRYNLTVSSGQELVTTADEYLDFALDEPSTRVVGLFLEQIRDPAAFIAALEKAAARDIPVVALKVGRTAEAARLAVTHSGARVGDDRAYQAVFDRHGVIRVASTHELAATLILFSGPRRVAAGGLAAILDSGGVRGMLLDRAADEGVPIAHINEATKAKLAARLEEGLDAVNPVDAWGTGRDFEAVFTDCMIALAEDPDTALVAFVGDIAWADTLTSGYPKNCTDTLARTDKPVLAVNDMGRGGNATSTMLSKAGVPLIDGTDMALKAVRHAFAYRDRRKRAPVATPAPVPAIVRERWSARLAGKHALDATETLALVADYGVTSGAAPADGVAMHLSIERDADFGPILRIAAGGEVGRVLDEAVTLLAPCDETEARRAVGTLRARRLFDDRPGALDSLAGAIARLSRVALDLGDRLERLEATILVGSAGVEASAAWVARRGGS